MTRQVWHRIPRSGLSHRTDGAGCHCGARETREADGTIWIEHRAVADWEKPSEAEPEWLQLMRNRDR